jgi:hypothetical protein
MEFSQKSIISHPFLKHFHRNNSIHKITTPSEGGNLQTDAAQLFLFNPIPAKAKKLGLLSIYKFSLLSCNKNNRDIFFSFDLPFTAIPLVVQCRTLYKCNFNTARLEPDIHLEHKSSILFSITESN